MVIRLSFATYGEKQKMTASISKIIADSEELLLQSQRAGESIAQALNKILASHLGWPYQVRAGSAFSSDGRTTGVFPTLVYAATEVESPPEPVSVSAESLACVIEVVGRLNLDGLAAAYEKIATAKSLRKTTAPPTPYLNTTFGVIFALESALPLEAIGEHLDEFNRTHPSYLWPDMVVVLRAGVLGYAGQFPGEPLFGDFLLPGRDIEWGAAMYVHLFARPGDLVLNRMCSVLFMHAALFSPGVKLPEREAILEGVPQIGMSIAAYQSKLKGQLVAVPDGIYRQGTVFASHPLRIEGPKGELLSHLRFIPWQDGGVVRIWGKLPLVGVLVFAGSIAKDAVFIKRDDGELSSVLPMTNSDFAQMVERLQRQSNMRVKPEPQPTWIVSKAYDEGTATPFMARLFLGVLRIRDQVYDTNDRKQRDAFDKTYEAVLMNAHSARAASKEIRELVDRHFKEVRDGACVARRGNAIHIDKNIDPQLRKQTETFLNSAGRAFKSMQELVRLLDVEIGFLYQKQGPFERGIEKLKKTQPELAAYFLATRAKWSERLTNARNALEHGGWVLPRVRYEDQNGVLNPVEPSIDDEPVSQFAEKMLERLACFIEEVSVHALQRRLMAGISLTAVPLSERDPRSPERFRLALVSGGLPIWRIDYHEKRFDEI